MSDTQDKAWQSNRALDQKWICKNKKFQVISRQMLKISLVIKMFVAE